MSINRLALLHGHLLISITRGHRTDFYDLNALVILAALFSVLLLAAAVLTFYRKLHK